MQDLGRIGWQALGVPVSGALDGFSLRLGNALVGNPPETAALEILHSGPSFEVAADTVRVAVAGIGAALAIEGERGRIVAAWHSVSLVRGEVFQIVLGREFGVRLSGRRRWHRGAAGPRQRLDLSARRARRL